MVEQSVVLVSATVVIGADDEIRTRDIDVEQSVVLVSATVVIGADDEIRTRDIDLGKVALYQLSYIRMPSGDGGGMLPDGVSRPAAARSRTRDAWARRCRRTSGR